MEARCRRAAVVVALLVAIVPATATIAASDTGTIAEESYDGDGYAAWELSAEAGDEIELRGTAFADDASMEAIGFWVLDGTGELAYAAVLSHYYGPGTIASVSAGPAGNVASVTDGGATGGGFLGITSFDVPVDGIYHVVAMGVADGANQGSLSIVGPDSVTLEDDTSGEAFLAKPPSFDGTGVSLAAETPEPNYLGAQGRVLVDATYPVDVDGRLFGLFDGDTNTGELEMSVDTPAGTLAGDHLYFLHGDPPGEYAFRVDENVDTWDTEGACEIYGPDICTQPTIFALGADVVLP